MTPRTLITLSLGVCLTTLGAPASADVLFKPISPGPEVFSLNGNVVSQPVSNPDALQNPLVYFIFVGPDWVQGDGTPSTSVNKMVASAKALLASSYLGGISQYGSAGTARFGGFTTDTTLDPTTWTHVYVRSDGTVDDTNNPVWFETNKILAEPSFSSWAPPPGQTAVASPIYVVVRYKYNFGDAQDTLYGGSNASGPYPPYTSLAVNVIDDLMPTADQVDDFTWTLSHELAERISTGTSSLGELSPNPGQIADGEPESGGLYEWRLDGGQLVTSYWSVMDQAFLVPDDDRWRTFLYPMWFGSTAFGTKATLREGNLSVIQGTDPGQRVLADSEAQSFAVAQSATTTNLYELTLSGLVKQYDPWGGTPTPLTDGSLVATQLVAQQKGGVYALGATNGGHAVVSQYSGTGTTWTPLTGSNTTVTTIAPANGGLFMLASNGGPSQVWHYDGTGANWATVTGTNTNVLQIASAADTLYMAGSNDGKTTTVFQYTGTTWKPVTGSGTQVKSIGVAGDVLYMLASNSHLPEQVWQYSLVPNLWTPLTGINTVISQLLIADNSNLYMVAALGTAPPAVWQFVDTARGWAQLTEANTKVSSIAIDATDHLHMTASLNGGPQQGWTYTGSPYAWTPAP